MSWNHRVVRRVYPHEISYEIHEAYYGLPDEGPEPVITENPSSAHGDTISGLRENLKRMLRALDKPTLDYKTRKEIEE